MDKTASASSARIFRPVDLRPTDMKAGFEAFGAAAATGGAEVTRLEAVVGTATLGAVKLLTTGRELAIVVDALARAGSTPPCKLRGCLQAVQMPSSGIPSSLNSIRVNRHLHPGAEHVLACMHTIDLSAKLRESNEGALCCVTGALLTAEGVAVAEDEEVEEVVVVFLGVVAGLGVGFSAAVLYRDLGGEAATTGAGLIGSAIENVLTGGCCFSTGGALVDFDLFTKLASLFCGAGAAATGDAAETGVTAAAEEEATTDTLPESICFPTPANLAFRNCSPIVDIF